MTPWTTIATAGALTLRERAGEYLVQVDGRVLMSSRRHASEEALAVAGCRGLPGGARVLVGGLGFGYTLRAALDALAPDARVVVAELSPAVVEWNRGVLAPLARSPLQDARVAVEPRDVQGVLDAGPFDAILLDVDNGPFAVSRPENAALYSQRGAERLLAALRPGGRLAVWSAGVDQSFDRRLRSAGFKTTVRHVASNDASHVLFIGERPAAPPSAR